MKIKKRNDGEFLRNRISELREQKGVSEQKMSLDLGRSKCYINNIMSGRAMPSFHEFIAICEYFKVEPKDFFDVGLKHPSLINEVFTKICKLDENNLKALLVILSTMSKEDEA